MTNVIRIYSGELSLEVRDDGGASPPFVLLHGLTSSRHIWDLAIPLLQPHRVVSYDQRGHGESDKPAKGYAFADMTRDLDGVLEALHIEAPVVVGHSWGASVALEFAATRPGRPLALVMVDGGFTELSDRFETFDAAWAMMKPPAIDGIAIEDFLDRAKGFMPVWNEQVEEMFMTMFVVKADGTVNRRFPLAQHKQVVRAMWEHRNFDLFARVACPTLLVPSYTSEEGRMADWMEAKRRGVARALELLPQGRVQEMQDTVHDSPVQRPRELAALMRSFAEQVQKDAELTRQ
jgi:pimeloyl-ACP methyl ester carboxylesterase